jgi:putative transposase
LPWSSAAAHLAGSGAPYVDVEPALARIDDFAAFVADEPDDAARWSTLLKAEQVGRPVGAKAWIAGLEKQYGRALSPAKRGPKPRLAPSPEDNGDLFGN